MMTTRLYLSASVANAPLNAQLRAALAPRFDLVLPQEFTPNVPHGDLPKGIFDRCIDEMERCDAGLFLLDAYGVDCATEAGWFLAKRKPLVGIVQSNTRFLQNWMLKGALSHVLCLDPTVTEVVRADPILRHVPVTGVASGALVEALAGALASSSGPR